MKECYQKTPSYRYPKISRNTLNFSKCLKSAHHISTPLPRYKLSPFWFFLTRSALPMVLGTMVQLANEKWVLV